MLTAKLAGEAILVCTSKVRFDTAGEARRARRGMRNAPRLAIYQCEVCGGHHFCKRENR